jgi:hypothetical protein
LRVLACLYLGAFAADSASPAGSSDHRPIVIARQGSFEAGGRNLGDPARASLSCDHGHVEYEIPVNPRKTAVFLWHSSSASVWQRRWDGGEGFQSKLLRERWPTYLWDGPRVGRANWGCEDYTYKAREGRDQGNFTAWRLGPRPGEFYRGEQFPINDRTALEQANRARYDEFDTVANAQLQSDAAAAAIDRIGPSVLLTNSAGGFRALLTALKSSHVRGIVAYENPGYVLPTGASPPRSEGPFGPVYVSEEEFARFAEIPMQFVWGDHVEDAPQWASAFALCQAFAKEVNARGGHVEILRLPDAGLHGNSHIPFADLNNDAVAKLLFDWLQQEGFE